jgi:hypothetical protein
MQTTAIKPVTACRMRKKQMVLRFAACFCMAWLLFSGMLLAQGAPGSIHGIVCEIKTCKPVGGVEVLLVHPGSEVAIKTTRTDVSGDFSFFDLQPGTYLIRARADNSIRVSRASAVITDGERIENVKLELTVLGTVSGSVFDENGEPVAHARVEVLAGRMNSPFLVLDRMVAVPQGSVTTDDQGAFRISGLDAYDYYIRVTPPANLAGGKTYPPTYYPSTKDTESAVKVFAGSANGINIRLVPGGVTLRGRFVSPSNAPARAAPVLVPRSAAVLVAPSLQPQNSGSSNSVKTEMPFEIRGVPPGSYYLYGITSDSKNDGPQWVRVPVEVGADDVNNITIVLSTPGTIAGRVSIAADATNADQFDLSRLTFTLDYAELTMALGRDAVSTRPNKGGEFRYERLPEATVFLRPSYLDDGWFISEMQLDGQDVMGSGFSSKPDSESALQVTISNTGGGIAGTIKDDMDRPVTSGRFVLLPEARLRTNPNLLKTGVANENGEFTINAIRPGNYTLLAFPDDDQFTPAFLRNRDLLEKYEAFGHSISLGAGQTIRADVTVVEPRR